MYEDQMSYYNPLRTDTTIKHNSIVAIRAASGIKTKAADAHETR